MSTANVATTPPSVPRETLDTPPGAPAKRRPEKHVEWTEFVGGMSTMPAKDARKLKPQDIGMHMGPMMDEAQFEAYRKSRQNVHVVSLPARKPQ